MDEGFSEKKRSLQFQIHPWDGGTNPPVNFFKKKEAACEELLQSSRCRDELRILMGLQFFSFPLTNIFFCHEFDSKVSVLSLRG